MTGAALPGVTDIHIHIQPWRQMKPDVADVMRRGKEAHWQRLAALMDDPQALLQVMNADGIWRVGLINYPSPDIMGFTDETNAFAAQYAAAAPERLIPFGGVHPRFTKDPEGQVEELLRLGGPGLQPVFVEQHFLAVDPLAPRGFGYVFVDFLAKFGVEGRFVQALQLLFVANAKNGMRHSSSSQTPLYEMTTSTWSVCACGA